MLTILIDPNVRVAGGLTYAGFEDVRGTGRLAVGELVPVREEESGLQGSALVAAVHQEKQLIYLDVDWATLNVDSPPPTSGQRGDFIFCGGGFHVQPNSDVITNNRQLQGSGL